jgi:hypothetical protein
MYYRQTPKRYDRIRFSRGCLVGTLLLMSLSILGCHNAFQVTDNNEVVSRVKVRPIDVDAAVAERIGQDALEKVGYDEIIKLAEKAGFVEYKSDERIQLASYGLFTIRICGGCDLASRFPASRSSRHCSCRYYCNWFG